MQSCPFEVEKISTTFDMNSAKEENAGKQSSSNLLEINFEFCLMKALRLGNFEFEGYMFWVKYKSYVNILTKNAYFKSKWIKEIKKSNDIKFIT